MSFAYKQTYGGEILMIYQGSLCRKVIELTYQISLYVSSLRFLGLGFLLLGMLFYFCESCIVENCLPEFKGTYDDTHDEIIAVDWSASEEKRKINQEIELDR